MSRIRIVRAITQYDEWWLSFHGPITEIRDRYMPRIPAPHYGDIITINGQAVIFDYPKGHEIKGSCLVLHNEGVIKGFFNENNFHIYKYDDDKSEPVTLKDEYTKALSDIIYHRDISGHHETIKKIIRYVDVRMKIVND